MKFGLLFDSLLNGVLYKLHKYIHIFMEFLVHFKEFYETAGEGFHLFLSELKNDHVSDNDQHLIQNGCSFGFKELVFAMDVAEAADYHGVNGVFLLQVDALEEDAVPVLDIPPETVLLEEVDYVQFVKLAVLARVIDVVSHEEDHHLLQGEGVFELVALGYGTGTESRN